MPLLKTPSGYIQQSPWVAITNKQLELMGRYMAELGMTPASRSRVVQDPRMQLPPAYPDRIEVVFVPALEGPQ